LPWLWPRMRLRSRLGRRLLRILGLLPLVLSGVICFA